MYERSRCLSRGPGMSRRARALSVAMVAACLLAGPAPLFAQDGGAAASAALSLGDVCELVGGAVTLGFGVWHFAVPGLYAWQSYVPDAPQTLVDAVAATNFFFSLSLSLVGASSIAMPLLADSSTPVGRYWLWANVGLWTTRSIYQLVKPQGSFSPALQWGMTAAFVVTDLLFVVAALDATL
jgi:hypothetical protein